MDRRLVTITTVITMAVGTLLVPAEALAEGRSSIGKAISGEFPDGVPEGGTIVDEDTLSFEDGTVVLNLAPMAYGDCPDTWVCLWQDDNYAGRMLQFHDVTTYWQDLASYGFNDEMSSWRNRKNKDAKWAWNTGGGGTQRCMGANSSSSYVGNGDMMKRLQSGFSAAERSANG